MHDLESLPLSAVYMPNFFHEVPALIFNFRFLRTVSLISATEAALLLENFVSRAV